MMLFRYAIWRPEAEQDPVPSRFFSYKPLLKYVTPGIVASMKHAHGKRIAAGGVEAAATGFKGCDDFGGGLVGAAVQMDSDFEVVVLRHYRGDDFLNFLGRRYAYGVGERDRTNLLQLK